MTQDTDYFDVTTDDANEKRSQVSQSGRIVKQEQDTLLSLEEERRIREILNPF